MVEEGRDEEEVPRPEGEEGGTLLRLLPCSFSFVALSPFSLFGGLGKQEIGMPQYGA